MRASLSFAVLYGFLTALAFALWPLGRTHDVPVSALYRDAVAPERRIPRLRYVVSTVAVIATLAALAVLLAYDRKIAAIFVGAAAAVFLTLQLVAMLIMAIARRIPRPRFALLRLVLANIHRPGALTPSVVLSLGVGLALLVTLLADRRQSAPPVRRGAARQGAVGVLRRHPGCRRRALRRLRQTARRRTPATSACRCCADASSAPTACAPRT